MLRAPVLMRHIRDGPRKVRRRLSRRENAATSRDLKSSMRDVISRPALSCCSRFKSLNSSTTDSDLAITMEIRERTDAEHELPTRRVYYKDDEFRFRQRYTLKLREFSEYNIRIEVEPYQDLNYVKIGGSKYEQFREVMCTEKNNIVFAFDWSTCGLKMTSSKYRTVLPCVIKFQGYLEIRFELMVKIYRHDNDAVDKGLPLTTLGLNYTYQETECEGTGKRGKKVEDKLHEIEIR